MGFTKPSLPPVDPETFLRKPLMERMKVLSLHWVENGFGTPRMVHVVYIVKLVVLYAFGGILIATTTSDLSPWHPDRWWDQPIVYQKAILWTVLLETLGIAGSWGPLAGKFKPMTGGILFWARPGTIRLRPWRRVPVTAGDARTRVDVVLYLALLVAVAAPLFSSADDRGLLHRGAVVPAIVLLVLNGLRDKTVFLAARGEQYLPALVFFAVFSSPVDLIVALKLLIVAVWVGAGFSKFGKHFANVVPPMVSNSPGVVLKWIKRAHYRDFPRDIRPSRVADLMAHIGGTTVEILVPLVLLFSTNRQVTIAAVAVMVVFHLFIISTFPLAVPLEWNVLFGYAAIILFAGFPAQDGYGVGDMSTGWLIAVLAGLLFFPVLGNLRPDLVSFLPSMRQYSGNWASALWAFAPGAEQKLDRVVRPSANQVDQLVAFGYEQKWADVTMQQVIAWRTMHSQGRGLFSLLLRHLPDIDTRDVREAEFVCNSLIGFNFGDGHLHDESMIAAVQRQAQFEPGELIVVWVESQPVHKDHQAYKVIDAALGVIERGTWKVADAVNEQPWLPNGPIPLNVTWSASPRVSA